MLLKLISVFLGGGIGAVLRYSVSVLSCRCFLSPIYGTFIVNIIGCFLIGCIYGYIINKVDAIPDIIKIFLTTGLLGGLTTFSTLNFEVFELIRAGKMLIGFTYLFSSCFIGLFFTYLGYLFFSKI